ncbi:hypothetical protein BB558_007325 [Smittium angustum]|uniref:AMP-dependent synthetase/ligase domain-containing protein n=1 Tax=Smittium angustum TaxID=133377 RepID=A0A2U1IVA4_SMIAN|nr:hypothetical protein BB558_007325 [Smittium angustum]
MDYSATHLQSYFVPNSKKNGFSPIIRNFGSPESLGIKEYNHIKTVYDIFWNSVKEAPENPCLGHRPYNPQTNQYLSYKFQSYKQVGERVSNLGSGIIKVRQMHSDKSQNENILSRNWPVALYSIGRPEWAISDRALSSQSLFCVGLHDTQGQSQIEYILNHSEASVVICSLDKVHKLLSMTGQLPLLKVIISMDSFEKVGSNLLGEYIPSPFNTRSIDVLKHWAASKSIGLYDFKEVEEIGKQNKLNHHPPKPSDIYILLYTSGTTGNPKGVVTTHNNYTYSAISGIISKKFLSRNPVFMSYLTMAHCYEKGQDVSVMLRKGCIGYSCGDITKILSDTQALQPTVFPGVPRILSRFYDALAAITINAPGVKGMIARRAVSEKIENLLAGKGYHHSIWDPLIFDKTKAALSSKIELIVTGSAPLEPKILNFLRISFQSLILESYGMTEVPISAIGTSPEDLESGIIGVPQVGVEVRLRDVPDMEYLTTDIPSPRGEILLRCPSIFSHYYKDKEKTKEALVEDGWYATGDIAKINPNGTISIIDRKKSIFKLSQGEYVSPEKIENVLSKHPLIMQSFVYGYSTKNFVVGVIVPDPLTFIPWAKKLLLGTANSKENEFVKSMGFEQLTKNRIVNKNLVEEIDIISRDAGLNGFEIVKAVYIDHRPFDIESNEILTPTLKLKRFHAIKYYKDIIDNLYLE